MTPQERQQKSLALREGFSSTVFQFEGEPGGKIPFSFEYTGDSKIHCVVPGCGCTKVSVKDNIVSGHLDLDPIEKLRFGANQKSIFTSKNISVYFEDGQDFFDVTAEKIRVNNPNKIHVNLSIQGNIILPE